MVAEPRESHQPVTQQEFQVRMKELDRSIRNGRRSTATGVAAVLSVLAPGLGHLFLLQFGTGFGLLIAWGAVLALLLSRVTSGAAESLFTLVLAGVALALWIGSATSAAKAAQED